MNLSRFNWLFLFIFLLFTTKIAFASSDVYQFNQDSGHIDGSIHYALIGTYDAVFKSYQGSVTYDSRTQKIEHVRLEIKANSFHSKYPKLDRVVKSPRFLNVSQNPLITFESTQVKKIGDGFQVDGNLTLNGITRKLSFPFKLERKSSQELYAQGQWIIDRKKFDVIWSKILDHAGIVVGNQITVNWQITASK